MVIRRLSSIGIVVVATSVLAAGVASAGATRESAVFSCNGTYNNMTFGNVDVPSGAVCRMENDTINGSVTVEGQIYASVLDVTGSISSQAGKVVQIDSSSVDGNFSVSNLGGGPADQDSVSIVINDIGGTLSVRGNTSPTGDELVSSNTVGVNEIDAFNVVTGDLAITAETVSGSMVVYKNTGSGTKEVDGNTVTNILACFANQSPFEAHGNSGGLKLGPC